MAYEVEAKAWVDDWDAVERYLRAHCEFKRAFEKSDRYFLFPGQEVAGPGRNASAFRLRTDGDHAYVTFKEKTLRGTTEVNLEREFGVDDAEAFSDLTVRLGCREHFAKVKRGLHFELDGLTAELVEVEGLGAFLEVESVVESAEETDHTAQGERVHALIMDAGIPEHRLESRPYMEMLRDGV